MLDTPGSPHGTAEDPRRASARYAARVATPGRAARLAGLGRGVRSAAREDRPGWRNRHLDLVWTVREWDPDYIANDLCWAEGDGMHTIERLTSTGEDQLWPLIDRFAGTGAFTYPWNTDYPG